MKQHASLLLTLIALSAAATMPAQADVAAVQRLCGDLPTPPDATSGDSADETTMRAYGGAMRDYTAGLMAYLTCVDSHPATAADLSSASYRRDVIAHRRLVVDQLEGAITRFNSELRQFKTRQAQVAAAP